MIPPIRSAGKPLGLGRVYLGQATCRRSGRPLMAWCVSNAKIEQRANSVLVTRQASSAAKIDALAATLSRGVAVPQSTKSRFSYAVMRRLPRG
jgi:phage terminase large subunit-like protein